MSSVTFENNTARIFHFFYLLFGAWLMLSHAQYDHVLILMTIVMLQG